MSIRILSSRRLVYCRCESLHVCTMTCCCFATSYRRDIMRSSGGFRFRNPMSTDSYHPNTMATCGTCRREQRSSERTCLAGYPTCTSTWTRTGYRTDMIAGKQHEVRAESQNQWSGPNMPLAVISLEATMTFLTWSSTSLYTRAISLSLQTCRHVGNASTMNHL